jgi:hypothetical protein
MRRLLAGEPKGIRHELIGNLTRTTINYSDEYEPWPTTLDGEPYICPICGIEIGNDRLSTALSLEFEGRQSVDLMAWSHKECLYRCVETDEPDIDM